MCKIFVMLLLFMQIDLLIAGLGNPKKYFGTRHNIGADFLRKFAEEQGISWTYDKYLDGELAFIELNSKLIMLFLPTLFMNKSGVSIKKAKDKFNLKNTNILVVYDELNIPFGYLKLNFKKSSGGHNGLESIISTLKNDNFWRMRLGIGRANKKISNRKTYVLKQFSLLERAKIKSFYELFRKSLLSFIENGPENTMNKFNNLINKK